MAPREAPCWTSVMSSFLYPLFSCQFSFFSCQFIFFSLPGHQKCELSQECAICTILGRHFERGSAPAYVRDKYKILMTDREFTVVSGCARGLFPRIRFHFWPQRRHHTGILFLSCELPSSRSRQNSREPIRRASVYSLLRFWNTT